MLYRSYGYSLHIYLKPPSSFTTSATSKHCCCPALYLRYYLHFQKHQLHYHYQHTICFLFTSSTFYLKAVVSIKLLHHSVVAFIVAPLHYYFHNTHHKFAFSTSLQPLPLPYCISALFSLIRSASAFIAKHYHQWQSTLPPPLCALFLCLLHQYCLLREGWSLVITLAAVYQKRFLSIYFLGFF